MQPHEAQQAKAVEKIFAGDDGDLAGFARAVSGFAQIEAEFAFAAVVVHAVAGEALLSEHGAHVAIEIDGLRFANQKQD
jgi:NAD(P)H-hydrate repair Nnr-like enzyme with NAD(P)H-hydrate dehydratase domain